MTYGPKPQSDDVFLAVDPQNDFCPEGALAVPEGDQVIPVLNRLAEVFPHIVITQDWHPADHFSFASVHPGRAPFDTIEADYGPQTLWPDHCVQGTHGGAFHDQLEIPKAELIIRKGYDRQIDSYSAFYENDQKTPTGLSGYLRNRGFRRLVIAGLAIDYCVHFSALDAIREGFEVTVVEDGCRAIDLAGSLDQAMAAMTEAGVNFIRSDHVVQ